MRITLLGTGSPIPDPRRAGPSTLVTADGLTVLVDCGRGVLMRLVAAGVLPPFLDGMLITHLHSDHITDLNDMVTSRWVMSPVPNPLPILGPVGTAGVVDAIMAMLAPDISYRIAHHDDMTQGPQNVVTEVTGGGVVHDVGGVRITAAATDHRPVEPTLGFRVEHDDKVVVIGGDGVPCAGLDELCAGADVYVQTVLREELVRAVPMPRFIDTIDYHSTIEQAADTAQRAGVKTLVITHPCLLYTSPSPRDRTRSRMPSSA